MTKRRWRYDWKDESWRASDPRGHLINRIYVGSKTRRQRQAEKYSAFRRAHGYDAPEDTRVSE